MSCTKQKTPNEVLNYEEDWTSVLGAATIASDAWTVDSNLVIDSNTNTTTASTINVSGGLLGECGRMVIKMTDSTGLIHERTILVEIVPPHER